MDQPEISNEDVAALTESEANETPTTKDTKMTFAGIAAALKRAVEAGNLTQQQAAGMRRDMGISSGFFTSKKINPKKRKQKRKAAKAARKVNRNK